MAIWLVTSHKKLISSRQCSSAYANVSVAKTHLTYKELKYEEYLASIEALGRASEYNLNTFMVLLNRALPKFEQQYELISPNGSMLLSSGDKHLSSFDKSLKQALIKEL